MVVDTSLIGVGLYSLPEAALLTGVSRPRIRRWVGGYEYRSQGKTIWSPPLWSPQLPEIQGQFYLGFRDLAEVRVVETLVRAGLALPTIRRAMERARHAIQDQRPFSTNKFRTDGKTIFLELARESDEPVLLDLIKSQYGFRRLLEPSLKDLDFNEEHAIRWWPLSRQRTVVVDPNRHFGQPLVNAGGVPTRVLSDAVEAEGSIESAARAFEVTRTEVRDAVAFEQRLAA